MSPIINTGIITLEFRFKMFCKFCKLRFRGELTDDPAFLREIAANDGDTQR